MPSLRYRHTDTVAYGSMQQYDTTPRRTASGSAPSAPARSCKKECHAHQNRIRMRNYISLHDFLSDGRRARIPRRAGKFANIVRQNHNCFRHRLQCNSYCVFVRGNASTPVLYYCNEITSRPWLPVNHIFIHTTPTGGWGQKIPESQNRAPLLFVR